MSSLSSIGGSSGSSGTGLTGLNTSGISFQGLVSGLNTDAIIQGLLAPEQAVITNLQNQQAHIAAIEAAYNTIQADLTALQSSLAPLSSSTNSVFGSNTITSSNSAIATATATSSAVPGQYSFTVNNLAQQQIISSQGFNSATSAITQGTFSFQVGSGTTQTVTINSSNATLQGLANAINNLSAGVTASIVNDGSSNQGYHLVLESNNAGTANAITITNNLGATSGSTMRPELNSTYIGAAVTGSGWTGTAAPVSNQGSGSYTGTNNDTFTFTVTNGGNYNNAATTYSYTNSSGSITGTITGNNLHNNSFYTIPGAEGLQLEMNTTGGNNVVTGQTFTIKAFNPNTQAAANTSVTLGSGSGGLTVSSSSNTFNNLFPGVNVTVLAASSTPVTLTVANNSQGAATAINSFVTAYNALISYVNQNDSYNAQTQTGGILLGDFHATSIPDQLSRTAMSVINGVNPLANELTAIGITINGDGTLAVNSNTLNQALNGQLSGISANDVHNLFMQNVSSSNPSLTYIYAPTTIQAINGPIQVQVTQAATQGTVTGTVPVAASTVITAANNTFSLTVDGQNTGTITLPTGTYTQSQLTAQLQSSINAQLNGPAVTVSLNGSNDLVINSNSYGSHSNVTVGSTGTALTLLGLSANQSGSGQDVAGSFSYNGITEAATGSGQYLTSNSSNRYTGGLEVLSTLTSAQITSTPEGTITFTQGVAAQLGNVLTRLLDPVNGQLTLANQALQSETNNIGQSITNQQTAMQKEQQQLLAEFQNMETVLAQLQTAGNSLTNSLTSFTPTSNSSTGH